MRKHFARTYNGTFTLEINFQDNGNGYGYSVFRAYSYGLCIVQTHYQDGGLDNDLTFTHMCFESMTTRRHLGIARAINAYFTAHDGNPCEMIERLRATRSLRDLTRLYGYISIKD